MIDFERFMTEYAGKIGVAEAVDFDDGICHLDIAGRDIGFMRIPEVDAILVWSALKACPSEGAETFYRLLLRLNFMGRGIREGAFSVSEDNVAYAHRTFSAPEADPEGFAAAVERFVKDVEAWHDAVEHAQFADDMLRKVASALDEPPSGEPGIRV